MSTLKGILTTVALATVFWICVYILLVWTLGCAPTQTNAQTAIKTAHEIGVMFREETAPMVNDECSAAVSRCLAAGNRLGCPEFEKCDKLRFTLADALVKYQSALKAIKIVVDTFEPTEVIGE